MNETRFGGVTYEGTRYAITSMPQMDNYGTDGCVAFYADAEDADGWAYKVTWLPTEEWTSRDGMDQQGKDDEACDWEHPESVVPA